MKTIEEYKRQWLANRESLPGLSLTQVKAMSLTEWAAYFGDTAPDTVPVPDTAPDTAPDTVPVPVPDTAPDTAPALDAVSGAIFATLRPHIERLLPSIEPTPTPAKVIALRGLAELGAVDGLHHYRLPTVTAAIDAGVPLLLKGPAGSAKSTLAKQAASLLQLAFYPQTFDAQMSITRLLGFLDANSRYKPTPFRLAYESGGLFVADEFDACSASVALALNTAIANGYCYFPDNELVHAHPDFRVVACANTNGGGSTSQYTGRNRLDAATLDRFAVLEISYDNSLEAALIGIKEECEHKIETPSEVTDRQWLGAVRTFRNRIAARGIDAVCSPRAVILGSKLLSAGVGVKDTIEMVLGKGRVEACLLEGLL